MNTNRVDWAGEVANAISAMKEETQKAYTYVKGEAPEVAREYIAWKRAESVPKAGCLVAAAIVLAAIAHKLWTKKQGTTRGYGEDVPEDMSGYYVGSGFMWILSACVMIALAVNLPEMLKPWIAPRIVIIEGIKEVVR